MENTILDVEELAKEHDYRDYLASKGKRFVNYLVDTLTICIIFILLYFLADGSFAEDGSFMANIYFAIVLVTFYFFTEFYTGKTLGKLITGTKVISIEGEKPTSRQIFYRSLSRIVPFEQFSMLFGYTAWHDDWSDTAVVNNNYK